MLYNIGGYIYLQIYGCKMLIQSIVTWKVHTHPFSWIFCCYHSFVLYDVSYTCCNNYNTYFDSRPTYIHKTKVRPCWLSPYNWCRWINNIFQLVARNKQIEHILIYFIFLTPYFDKWYVQRLFSKVKFNLLHLNRFWFITYV